MQLVELIVELGNHLLNVSALLLCVDLLEDGNFDILLREQALLDEGKEGLLCDDILELGISITAQLEGIGLIHLSDNVWVDQHLYRLQPLVVDLSAIGLALLTRGQNRLVTLVTVSSVQLLTAIGHNLRVFLIGNLLVLGQGNSLGGHVGTWNDMLSRL